jgi:prevent-host-death family protein
VCDFPTKFYVNMKSIPQHELRNRTNRVLRRVEAGECIRITAYGRPVADLVPVRALARNFVSGRELLQLLKRAPLDSNFSDDIEGATGATIAKP